MDQKIIDFISRQTCASICGVDENGNPLCFTCFYSFSSQNAWIIFKSSMDTAHARILQKNPSVAGTILPDKLEKHHLRGIQFEGSMLALDSHRAEQAAAYYYKKFPLALAIKGKIEIVQLNRVKFTDNQLGFGKKIIWERKEIMSM